MHGTAHSSNILKLINVDFARQSKVIFHDINLTVKTGQIVGIMGPSGTGKTTLLRLMTRQLSPNQGKVLFNGQDLAPLSRAELMLQRQRIGMLFQSGALFTDMTVFDNVAFPLRMHRDLTEQAIRKKVLYTLHSVGLKAAASLMPAQLSGGMQRRVALARTIILEPDVVLYDEPFTGQDPIAMGVLLELITSLNKKLGMTSVIVSHNIQETSSISDYLYILSNTQIIGSGTPEAIVASTEPHIRQFVHGLPDGPVPFHYQANTTLCEKGASEC